jgi:predicted amidohydrolase YtcJ
MRRRTFIASTAALAGSSAVPVFAASQKADLIVTAGTIHTVDQHFVNAKAFAIANGRFVYVGSLAGARAFAGPRTKTLDLGNATVLPGLIDAHLHLVSVGAALHEVDLFHVTSFEEIVRRTVAFAHNSSDMWVIGEGWDQNLWPGKAFPTHNALSAALPDRAVVLNRVDGHALLANAKAMQLAGVSASTADPSGGRILRDASGAPTGVFIDNAMGLIGQAIPPASDAQIERSTFLAIQEANRWGVTAIGDPGVSHQKAQAYDRVADAGKFSLRNHVMIADNPELIAAHLDHGIIDGAYDGRISVRAIKLFVDGALGSRGAALLEPYDDDPSNTGLMRTTQMHIEDVATLALRAGFQTCVHAIGDRGNRVVLDAYEAALRNVPSRGHRMRIEHAQVLSPQDIPRFARLGVLPSMQTTHQISDMGWAQARLGPQRVLGAYAWRSLLDTGVIIPNGTDAPVEAVNSLRTFHAAISRQNEANQPPGGWFPSQRMSRDEALKSMTMWAAYGNFQEHGIGSITPGKHADFVVMDRDWMTVEPDAIMETHVLATYFAGAPVYEASRGAAFAPLRARRSRGHCCG